MTPLGGVTVFVAFLHTLGFVEKVRQHMRVQWRSPNQIDLTATFTAFLVAVLAGAKRHANFSQLQDVVDCVPLEFSGLLDLPLAADLAHERRDRGGPGQLHKPLIVTTASIPTNTGGANSR